MCWNTGKGHKQTHCLRNDGQKLGLLPNKRTYLSKQPHFHTSCAETRAKRLILWKRPRLQTSYAKTRAKRLILWKQPCFHTSYAETRTSIYYWSLVTNHPNLGLLQKKGHICPNSHVSIHHALKHVQKDSFCENSHVCKHHMLKHVQKDSFCENSHVSKHHT